MFVTKIAFLCPREEIVTWLQAESEAFPYDVVQDPSTADACVVLAGDEEEAAWAAERIPEETPVLWFGVLPDTAAPHLVYHDPETHGGDAGSDARSGHDVSRAKGGGEAQGETPLASPPVAWASGGTRSG